MLRVAFAGLLMATFLAGVSNGQDIVSANPAGIPTAPPRRSTPLRVPPRQVTPQTTNRIIPPVESGVVIEQRQLRLMIRQVIGQDQLQRARAIPRPKFEGKPNSLNTDTNLTPRSAQPTSVKIGKGPLIDIRRFGFMNEQARINTMRDKAMASGNLEMIRRADRQEKLLRDRYRVKQR